MGTHVALTSEKNEVTLIKESQKAMLNKLDEVENEVEPFTN